MSLISEYGLTLGTLIFTLFLIFVYFTKSKSTLVLNIELICCFISIFITCVIELSFCFTDYSNSIILSNIIYRTFFLLMLLIHGFLFKMILDSIRKVSSFFIKYQKIFYSVAVTILFIIPFIITFFIPLDDLIHYTGLANTIRIIYPIVADIGMMIIIILAKRNKFDFDYLPMLIIMILYVVSIYIERFALIDINKIVLFGLGILYACNLTFVNQDNEAYSVLEEENEKLIKKDSNISKIANGVIYGIKSSSVSLFENCNIIEINNNINNEQYNNIINIKNNLNDIYSTMQLLLKINNNELELKEQKYDINDVLNNIKNNINFFDISITKSDNLINECFGDKNIIYNIMNYLLCFIKNYSIDNKLNIKIDNKLIKENYFEYNFEIKCSGNITKELLDINLSNINSQDVVNDRKKLYFLLSKQLISYVDGEILFDKNSNNEILCNMKYIQKTIKGDEIK